MLPMLAIKVAKSANRCFDFTSADLLLGEKGPKEITRRRWHQLKFKRMLKGVEVQY